MKIVGYKSQWTPQSWTQIILLASQYCRHFLLVAARNRVNEAKGVLRPLSTYLVENRIMSEWPGTVKIGGEANEVFKFEMTKNSTEILIDEIVPILAFRRF